MCPFIKLIHGIMQDYDLQAVDIDDVKYNGQYFIKLTCIK